MPDLVCSVEACDQPRRRYGLCGMHSQRLKRYGTTNLPEKAQAPCAGPGCVNTINPALATSGLCRSHYKQHHLGKQLTPLRVATKDLGRPELCTVPDCGRRHKARGLCKTHNAQAMAGRPFSDVQPRLAPGPCSVDDCGSPRFANTYCTKHNANRIQRWYDYGLSPNEGAAMYARQQGACAGCGEAYPLDALHIDHDHSCCARKSCGACVRGLLCRACNLAAGHAQDNPDRLRSLAAYLELTQLWPKAVRQSAG